MDIDEARSQLSDAGMRLTAAQEQFDTTLPGWPSNFVGPATSAQYQALQTLVDREKEMQVARQALLDALADQKNVPDA
jgi:hypothetical protein